MYTLKYENYALLDPSAEILIRDPSCHLAVNEPGDLSFTIDSNHPNYSQPALMSGILELKEDGVVIYRGRIVKESADFNLSKTIESEGLLACLNDSIVNPFEFPEDYADDPDYQTALSSGNVVEYFLSVLLDNHNANVSADQQIKLGTVTVSDPNNYISRSETEYKSTWETIGDKLFESSLGGYILPRYESDGVYLDYLADFPLTNTQTVEFAKNLTDIVNENDATEHFTAILPVGAEGLTIADLADEALTTDLVKDGLVIYSISGVAAYGRITKQENWEDVTVAANLRDKAAALLASAGVSNSISIRAADLKLDGSTTFRVGRYTRLESAPHNFSALYPLMELDPDLLDPGNTEITLGCTVSSAADLNKAAQRANSDRDNRQQLELNQRKSDIEDLAQTTTEQITSAIQTSQEIIFTALTNYVETSDYETFKETIQATLSIMSDQIEAGITTVEERVTEVDGDLQTIYDEILHYFRFTEDGLYIGETGNDVLLRLDNDLIQFLRNNVPVLFITDEGVQADSITASLSVSIGNFEITQEQDGRLSLRRKAT